MPLALFHRPRSVAVAVLACCAIAPVAATGPTTYFCIERLHPPACVTGSWVLDDDAFADQVRPMLTRLRSMGASDLTWTIGRDSGEEVTIAGDGQMVRQRRTNIALSGTDPDGVPVRGTLKFTDEVTGTLCQHDAEPRWLHMVAEMERTVDEAYMTLAGERMDLGPAFSTLPFDSFDGSFTYRCAGDELTIEMADRSLGAFRQKLVLKRKPR